MSASLAVKKKRCPCGCKREFTPSRKWQRYFSAACGNKMRQRRLHKRARIGLKIAKKMRELNELSASDANAGGTE